MADLSGLRASIAIKVGAVSGIAVSTSSNFGGVVDVPRYMVNTVSRISMNNHVSPGVQQRELEIPADLLLAKTDVPSTIIDSAETIIEDIYAAAILDLSLGYPDIVSDSWIETTDIGEMTYAGQQWIGAKQIWHVQLYEEVNRTAAP
jgi:hypothetical protein